MSMPRRFASLIVVAAAFAAGVMPGCQSDRRTSATTVEPAPRLFDGLGHHHRRVTTMSAAAQKYFDQGLTWAYAFNHDEAIRSFTEAARLDPNCAMAWWGVAFCHGPHINNPVVPRERAQAAWDAVQKALALEPQTTPVERGLILAVAKRYSADPETKRAPLDAAYADAMVELHRANPRDADIATLAAESLMDLQPWDLWTKDGQPKGRTPEIVAALESAIQLNPDHPGALHLYIHAMEASPQAAKAVPAANRLRTLVPAAGHLVHMPSHIDVRMGRWDLASEANQRAIAADAAYARKVPRQAFYRVYMAHNNHFLAYSAMMQGRFKIALSAARNMMTGIPPEFLEQSAALVDPYTAIEYQVLLRFGKWDELLARPAPHASLPVTTAQWRFARASALAAKNDVDAARSEQARFREAVAKIPEGTMTAINKASDVLDIAERVLEGEIAFREKRIDDAVKLLRDAAEREDKLVYMEPPEWIQPVRHSLAAILLASGRAAEAETAYREDLARWPESGWALYGLSEALRAQDKTTEADKVTQRFNAAWKQADTKIDASCLCVN
jgi:tetratricopeptide (TPR) repeat protein